MISIRFSGPIEPMMALRDSMKPMGATRVGYKVNNDGLTARLYVDCGAAMSEDVLRRFDNQAPQQKVRPLPPDQVVIDVDPTPARTVSGPVDRFRVTWRR